MTTEAKAPTFIESNSTAFLYKSLKRLYIYAQFIGGACFSYSDSNQQVYVTRLNLFALAFFTLIYMTAGYLNFTLEKTTDATGYQAILFFIGEHAIPSEGIIFIWPSIFAIFLARKKIARVMLDLINLDTEVREHVSIIIL